MAAAGDKKIQPIVIKRIKKISGGHHGAAWKIAYADFVTAMMAFFLLMWLLGSTTKGDLQGIADYFSSPLKVAMGGGSGSGDASHVIKGGGSDLTRTTGQVKRGEIDPKDRAYALSAARAERQREETQRLEVLRQRLSEAISLQPRLAEFQSQIRLDLTPDGLRIQLVDEQNRPMFDSGGAVVKDYMRDLLREIGRVLNTVDNRISLSGHTDSRPFSGGERGYSNWELSADRANASRRELIAGGMSEAKIARVIGLAAAVPLDAADPAAPVNRRISIVVLNREAEMKVLKGTEVEVSDRNEAERAVEGRVKKETP